MNRDTLWDIFTAPFALFSEVIKFYDHPLSSFIGLLWLLKVGLASVVSGRVIVPEKGAPEGEGRARFIYGIFDDILLVWIIGGVIRLSTNGLEIGPVIFGLIAYIISVIAFVRFSRQPWYIKVVDDCLSIILLSAYALISTGAISIEIVANSLRTVFTP